MESVLITGGTGLVGTALTRLLLERGYKVIILTRKPEQGTNRDVRYAAWDVAQQTIDINALQEADYIVHLAGANVGEKRWTAARKREILESRTKSSELIVKALQTHPNKIRKVISASATGYYGESSDRAFIETDPPATDYLGSTTLAWEQSIAPVAALDKKLVIFRTGIALSREGGALKEFYKPLRFGFATVLGSGDQYISWIHIQDLVRLYFNAIVNDQLEGIYNAVAPQPVRHKELMLTMARAAKGNSFITSYVPAFALKLALGEMSVEILKSVNVSSRKIQDTGFQFSYPTIGEAMEQLFK
ncbi:TIGR01777 family oxidoreductase [Chitinophaga qingshengii]|uniref:TIGR01777 family protein n=1 Tax=Chitinophaga qingshengii TaxID=1569794 RepID=A0ABR7TK20_9BACT|nr:TIGR01777 family oxidoreductase [Chitinophaga qingshengii]MBC9930833.1 TIGR01777 family protein [Chitinophaga qingshengii]